MTGVVIRDRWGWKLGDTPAVRSGAQIRGQQHFSWRVTRCTIDGLLRLAGESLHQSLSSDLSSVLYDLPGIMRTNTVAACEAATHTVLKRRAKAQSSDHYICLTSCACECYFMKRESRSLSRQIKKSTLLSKLHQILS